MDKTEDFNIDEAILAKARKRDFLKIQVEMARKERNDQILICLQNGICPRCGDEQILVESSYGDSYYTYYRCVKCKLEYLDNN